MEDTSLKLTASDWVLSKQDTIQRSLETLKGLKSFTLPDLSTNLNAFHGKISEIRGTQDWVRTYLITCLGMELDLKRRVSSARIAYKDAMGLAFVSRKDVIDTAKSFEEKTLRLRQYVPEIRELEEWEDLLKFLETFKEAVQLVYDDLSKASMALSVQSNVIKSQILTGDLKIQIDGFTAQSILKDNTMTAIEKASASATPRGEMEL